MVNIKLYNISDEHKKMNKTLGNALYDLTGTMLPGESILRPSIRIEIKKSSGNIKKVNYAYIEDYGRYYYIDNPIWVGNDVWILPLVVDVLKSHMNNILSSSAFVARTSSMTQYNPDITDSLFPISVDTETTTKAPSDSWEDSTEAFNKNYVGYHYVITMACSVLEYFDNSQEIAGTGTAYFVTNYNGAQGFFESMANSFGDLINYVVDIRWFPFVPSHGTKKVRKIYFGSSGATMDLSALPLFNDATVYLVNDTTHIKQFTVPLPDGFSLSGYDTMPPFANLSVKFLPFGVHPLSMAWLREYGKDRVTFRVETSILSGVATLSYYAGDKKETVAESQMRLLATQSVCVSVPTVGSHGIANAISGIVSPTLGGIGAGATAGAKIGGGYGAIAGGIIGGISSFAIANIQYQDLGMVTNGGAVSIVSAMPILIFTKYKMQRTQADIKKKGLPCAKVLTLAVFGAGDYVQCDEVDLVSDGMSQSEYEECENLLKRGIYI